MRILYVGMKYDYGQPERGFGFEHYNFYDSLVREGHDIFYFDFMTLFQQLGKAKMNQRLWDLVVSERPDVMFTILFTDQLDPDVVARISSSTDTVTLNWFCDDHWRFDNYSKYWAPAFNWVVTTATSALPKYLELNYKNVIKSQWGCNHHLYRRLDVPMKHPVSFVGQPHGNRREIIEALRSAGIDVRVWGAGWDSGRLSQDEMIRVFNESRININLSNASVQAAATSGGVGETMMRGAAAFLKQVPGGHRITNWGKRLLARPLSGSAVATEQVGQYAEQIKGRNFEVPGCGGFLVTGHADDLASYYQNGKEVVVFNGVAELIDRCRYYLEHEDERKRIADAGYRRTLAEHTYRRRFQDIFRQCGLTAGEERGCEEGTPRMGSTVEVT